MRVKDQFGHSPFTLTSNTYGRVATSSGSGRSRG
jgi:hypothetical protein